MPIDYNKYPPNWKGIVARIKARDENKCKFCGVPNGATIYSKRLRGVWRLYEKEGMESECDIIVDGVKTTKIVLTIAHLNHNSENWEVTDDRLAALCQACHLAYDHSRHVAKRKYGMEYFKHPKLFD